jgi:hypothetical protein
VKLRKKRSGKVRKYRVLPRFMYDKLYNGLHAKSDVKRRWFDILIKAFRAEVKYTEQEANEESSDTATDDDRYIPWERQKRV